MLPIRTTPTIARFCLVAGLVLAFTPLRAQEGEPAPAQDPTQDEAPAKPKSRPRPVAKPKPAEAAKPRPASESTLLEPSAAAGTANWPNGAKTVSESYGDWTMNCQKEGEKPDCVIIQSQGDRRTGRRQFSLELRVPKDGRSEGLMLMPFGLQIEPGVSFKLDDRALGKGAPYSYCVSDGCIVPISLPTLATDTMKTAQSLSVSAMKPDAKEPTTITVPLSGFAAAFARAIALGG